MIFEVEGNPALGFDTGLDTRAFARTKSARFITEKGIVVFPDGRFEPWQASGLVERTGSIVVWGPAFAGERLDSLINDDSRKDKALAAVLRWIRALLSLDAGASAKIEVSLRPWGALVAPDAKAGDAGAEGKAGGGDSGFPPGAVFFPPETLMLRCARAEGSETLIRGGEAFVHPDLSGLNAAAFCAAALLYRIFTGALPFPAADETLLHADLREGVFIPAALAAPGLDENLAALIQETLAMSKKITAGKPDRARETLVRFTEILRGGDADPAGAAGDSPNFHPPSFSSFFHPPGREEREKINKERELFRKRKNLAVKTRRFAVRNTALIAGISAAVLIAFFAGRSIAAGRAGRPSTAGMTPLEVIQNYYGAFEKLDHEMMQACVTGGAGKNDISRISNFFVISRIRQAYEYGAAPLPVPRVTDIRIEKSTGDEAEGEFRCRAR
ncbi:MAG: hypothetical protein LBJ90_02755, partial [Treponema sp.]|nr:hypothetical protein [Treponema sp.]